MTSQQWEDAGRRAENFALYMGVGTGVLYVLGVEILPHVVAALHCAAPPSPFKHGIPWGVVLIVVSCVAPKTVGRARLVEIVKAIAEIVKTRFGRTPGSSDNG